MEKKFFLNNHSERLPRLILCFQSLLFGRFKCSYRYNDMLQGGILLCFLQWEKMGQILVLVNRENVWLEEHYLLYVSQPDLLCSKSCSNTEALWERPSLLNCTRCCCLSDIYLNFHLPGQLNDIGQLFSLGQVSIGKIEQRGGTDIQMVQAKSRDFVFALNSPDGCFNAPLFSACTFLSLFVVVAFVCICMTKYPRKKLFSISRYNFRKGWTLNQESQAQIFKTTD